MAYRFGGALGLMLALAAASAVAQQPVAPAGGAPGAPMVLAPPPAIPEATVDDARAAATEVTDRQNRLAVGQLELRLAEQQAAIAEKRLAAEKSRRELEALKGNNVARPQGPGVTPEQVAAQQAQARAAAEEARRAAARRAFRVVDTFGVDGRWVATIENDGQYIFVRGGDRLPTGELVVEVMPGSIQVAGGKRLAVERGS